MSIIAQELPVRIPVYWNQIMKGVVQIKYERKIGSLCELLIQFGITFEISDRHKNRLEYRKLREEKLSLSEIRERVSFKSKTYLAEVAAYVREDTKPATDVGIEYGVVNWDSLAAESLAELLGDLAHAASCGCDGCESWINKRLVEYRQRK